MRERRAAIVPRLTAFDATMVVVSLVIGIGIFRTPALVAAGAGSPAAFLLAWGIGGAVALAGALTFAEIGSRMPRAGAYYAVLASCWHPATAFMFNWAQVLMQGVGAAGVAFIGVEYLLSVAAPGAGPGAVPAGAAVLLSGLLALNAIGIRTGARAQNVLSAAKIVMIAGLATAAFVFAPAAGSDGDPAPPGGGMLAALVAVFYTFGGYQTAMNLAGDVTDAPRNLPRAVTAGMLIVTGVYLVLNLAYVSRLGVAGVAGSKLVAATLARACLGPSGEAVVSIAIFLSAAGFVNATILQVPRSYVAMAEDGVLPALFLRVNPRTQVQGPGLAFFALTSLVPVVLLGTFEKLLDYVMFTDTLTIASVASCVFVLRRREPEPGAVYQMPGYPWLPALYVACNLAIAARVFTSEPRLSAAGTAILLAGYPLWRLMRRASAARGTS